MDFRQDNYIVSYYKNAGLFIKKHYDKESFICLIFVVVILY